MKILLTGGAGFIGSHTFAALADAGYTPVIHDNFAGGAIGLLRAIECAR